ncbi:hypothetical protein MLD38_024946 [Melastoma candidum]|uniref:Uncharacterized protein n=1 Tax=Melastoma candidum TaxID=119954 RepID=A0ACB9NXB9_9MYRT|nr:hypothetical protein MLD38_024946 [Melastoma candidum]
MKYTSSCLRQKALLLCIALDLHTGGRIDAQAACTREKCQQTIKSLECFAIDNCISDEQRRTAGMILKAMGLTKTASSAVNLLIEIGYFPVHVNIDLLKIDLSTLPSDEVVSAAASLLSESDDPDEVNRRDLSHLKVYAI